MSMFELISIIFGSLIECFVFSFYLNAVCEPKYNKYSFFILLSVSSFLQPLIFFNNYSSSGLFRGILNFGIVLSLVILCFKDKLWYKLLCTIALYFGNTVIASSVLLLYEALGLDTSGFYELGGIEHWIARGIITVGQMLIALLIIRIIKRRISESMKIAYYFIGAVTMLYFIQLYLVFLASSSLVDFATIILILFSASMVSVSFIFFAFRTMNKLHKQEILEAQQAEQYKYLTEQYELMQKNNTEFRKLRHDFKDHMLVIDTLAKNGETQKLSAYVSKIRDDINHLDDLVLCKNTALNIVAASKYRLAQDNGIDVNITIRDDDKLTIDEIYVCSLISNILQNAAENTPCGGSIDFRMFIKAGSLVITCKNDTSKKRISLKTSKPDKERHGYGLMIIDDIVKRMDGNCIREQNGLVFSTMITIPLGERVE